MSLIIFLGMGRKITGSYEKKYFNNLMNLIHKSIFLQNKNTISMTLG